MGTRAALGLPGPQDGAYWEKVRARARDLKSDGCSGPALEFYHDACLEHDIHYRTGETLFSRKLTRAQADAIFWERMAERSKFGRLSPMAWWRWAGVRVGGSGSWQGR